MGLTIHYEVSIPTTENIVEKLEKVRQKCLDLPFEEVNEVKDIEVKKETIQLFRDLQKQYSYPHNSSENLEKRDKMMEERGVDTWTVIMIDRQKHPKNHHLAQLSLWAGKGCEGTEFSFTKKRKYWKCSGFTKTQYAEQFVKCHLLVIKALDLLKEQGFTVKVSDEGHYWETRDLKVLAKNINDYTALIKSIFGTIKDKVDGQSNVEIVSSIEGCENYMNVEED